MADFHVAFPAGSLGSLEWLSMLLLISVLFMLGPLTTFDVKEPIVFKWNRFVVEWSLSDLEGCWSSSGDAPGSSREHESLLKADKWAAASFHCLLWFEQGLSSERGNNFICHRVVLLVVVVSCCHIRWTQSSFISCPLTDSSLIGPFIIISCLNSTTAAFLNHCSPCSKHATTCWSNVRWC